MMGIVLGPTEYATTAEAIAAGAPVIKYGAFLNAVINFLIVAFAMFSIVKVVNKVQDLAKKEEEAAPAPDAPPAADIVLLTEIRDLLRDRA